MRRWINWIQANPKTLVTVWIVFFAVMATCAGLLKPRLKVGGFSIPGTQFHEASAILSQDFGMASEKLAVAAFHSDKTRVTEVAYHDEVEAAMARLSKHPTVERIESFYNTGIPDLVSFDNHTTYSLIHLKGTEEELERATPEYRELVKGNQDVSVALTGQPVANFDIESLSSADVAHVDVFTFPLIFLLLVVFLRSWRAAIVPLSMGVLSVMVSLGGIYLLTHLMNVSIFAMNIATMIGIGLAVDFSLILLFRFQEELGAGVDSREAAARALEKSGKSVFFSGFTLFTTVSILTLFPIMILRSIAQAILISALSALLVFFTLLPAVVLKWGHHFAPKPRAGGAAAAEREGLMARVTAFSIRRPWIAAISTLALLLTLAYPALSMRKIGTTLEGVPPTVGSRQAVDTITGALGKGAVAPLLVVIKTSQPDGIWTRDTLKLIHKIHAIVSLDPRVDKVQSLMSLVPNPSENWAQTLAKEGVRSNPDLKRIASRFVKLDEPTQSTFLFVYSKTAETAPETIALLEWIRDQLPEWQKTAPGVTLLVGGTPAQHYDFDKAVYSEAFKLVLASLAITFFVLLVFFRSLVLPLKAVLMNLLSLASSYGLLVLVFQKGYGAWLLGFHSLGGVQVYTPVLLFSILFGLSTDYEVFVLSRVKEFVDKGHGTAEATFLGIKKSSRVIGAAATVMVLVFFSFAFSSVVAVKEIGFSLAVAVLLDATVVRMALVPASMVLMERLNWWIPGWLGRILPEVED